jgi:DNA repair protein RadC
MYEQTSFPIRNWLEDDRPREKLRAKGKSALTDAELLAIVIASGSRTETAVALSQRLLLSVGNSLSALSKMSPGQLMQFKGIGQVKALSIIAAMELGRRCRESGVRDLVKVTSSRSVFEIMQPVIGELQHEEFWILYLNNANKVVCKTQLSKGGLTGTVVDIRLAFRQAFEHGATGMILCHNHPSGTLTASDADRQITRKLRTAGESLDIKVLDHVIVTESGYMSFSDEGLL